MRAYSADLRKRVIDLLEAGEPSQSEIAETFGISVSTVEKWWHRWRTTGSWAVTPQRHGPERVLAPYGEFLRKEVARQPDATLEELCARVATVHGVTVKASQMCRELQRLALPRKKRPSTTSSAIRRG